MSFACALGMGTIASPAWSAKREPPSSWVATAPREQLAPFRILVAQGLRGGSRGAGLDTRLSVAGLWSADEAQPNSFCRFLALGANLGIATVRSLKVAHDPNSVSRVFLGPELRVGSAYLEDGPKQRFLPWPGGAAFLRVEKQPRPAKRCCRVGVPALGKRRHTA